MDATKTQPGRAEAQAVNNTCKNCNALQARIAELESQIELKSKQFSEAIAQLSSNRRVKARAEELDERFVEQCVLAKSEAELELNKKSKQFAEQLNTLKSRALANQNELVRQINKLKQELIAKDEDSRKKISQLTENARHDAARYEQIITKSKAEAAEKIEAAQAQAKAKYAPLAEKLAIAEKQNARLKQEYANNITLAKNALARKSKEFEQATKTLKQQYESIASETEQKLNLTEQQLQTTRQELESLKEQVNTNKRAKARAEQLNQRLLEQCNMAKIGADTEVDMRTREFTENITRLKGQAAAQIRNLANQNNKLKTQAKQVITKVKTDAENREHVYSDSLEKANARIRTLEQIINRIQKAEMLY